MATKKQSPPNTPQIISLKSRYSQLETGRQQYLDRARACAKVTIPFLIPPAGANASTQYPTPKQSLGARGLNNLAAKILLALLPPNTPFFKLAVADFALDELMQSMPPEKSRGLKTQVEVSLNKIERAVMGEIETTAIRAAVATAIKHLLVAGNCLAYLDPKGGMKTYSLTRYVTKRDPMGNTLEIITKEDLSPAEVPDELLGASKSNLPSDSSKLSSAEDVLELYTCIKRNIPNHNWDVWQELNGVEIPDSRGTAPLDRCPWLNLRYTAIDGEDYGRGFVEEYLGDLTTLESLSKAIIDASLAASKVIFLVKPNSTTTMKTLAEANSGDIKQGNAQDITVVQMDKFADFRVTYDTIQKITESLSYSFMLNSAIQRSGERVTAEEIRYMANELESTQGGIYSTLAQELQLPLVTNLMSQMEASKKLPVLPKGVVKPAITTGVEAIGRGQDLTKLAGFLQDLAPLGQQVVAQYVDVGDYIKRCAVARGIDTLGLIKDPEAIAAEQQAAQRQQLIQQVAPNTVNQLGGMMQKGMDSGAAPAAMAQQAAQAMQQPTQPQQ